MPQVRIRIEKGVETAGDGQEKQEAKVEEEKKEPVASPTAMLFYHQAIATGKQIVGYATSNVANFTGNNLLQDQVNQTMDVLGDLTMIAVGAGSKGIPGFIVATVGVTTKEVFQVISAVQNNVHLQNEQNYLLKRSGNATTNGSRGTEN